MKSNAVSLAIVFAAVIVAATGWFSPAGRFQAVVNCNQTARMVVCVLDTRTGQVTARLAELDEALARIQTPIYDRAFGKDSAGSP